MGCYCVVNLLTLHWSSGFWFWFLCSGNMSFLWSSLMRLFVVLIFFIFQDIVWLVKKSWCVLCCSIHQFYWVSDIAEADLRCGEFLSEKNCRHSTGSFSFFLVLTTRYPLSFYKFEKQSCLFDVDNAFFICWCYLVVLNFWFQFFSVEPCLFMCQWCGFSRYKFFHFWSQCLAEVFPLLITVSGWYYHFDVLICNHIFNSFRIVVVPLVNLRWSDFVSLKLSQIASFH